MENKKQTIQPDKDDKNYKPVVFHRIEKYNNKKKIKALFVLWGERLLTSNKE